MLDACGGRGNGQRDAEGLARAGSGKGSGKGEARGWTGRMGVGRGGNGEAEMVGGGPWGGGKGERGGDLEVGGGGGGDGKWGEGDGEVGNREGATERGQAGRWRCGRGISQMDIMKYLGGHMECLGGIRLQRFLTFVYIPRATPGTPASILIFRAFKGFWGQDKK